MLLLGGCASIPPSAACFAKSSDSVGWALIHKPPLGAIDMRNAAHEGSSDKPQLNPTEYWFRHFDGIVMLCEPAKNGCGASTTMFDKDESGAMVKSGGFYLVCVTAT
jgi:hypothetical protein